MQTILSYYKVEETIGYSLFTIWCYLGCEVGHNNDGWYQQEVKYNGVLNSQ